MTKRISDLLDTYSDPNIELQIKTPLSSERIKVLTMKKITKTAKTSPRSLRRVLIAADDSKIGRTGFSRVCGCDGNLSLVTNENSDPLAISALQSSGVNITLVK